MRPFKIREARETIVFVINYNGEVEESTLYDHVMASADKTTSPRGVMTRIFVEEIEEDQFDGNSWAIKTWGVCGRGSAKVIATFETEEKARDDWFSRIYNYDFMQDDQRDTSYYKSREEAKNYLAEREEIF